jgi:hypothetical protein
MLILLLLLFCFSSTLGYYINTVAFNSEEKIALIENEDAIESNTLNFTEEGQTCTVLIDFKNQIALGQKLRFHERQNLVLKDIGLSPETPPPNGI